MSSSTAQEPPPNEHPSAPSSHDRAPPNPTSTPSQPTKENSLKGGESKETVSQATFSGVNDTIASMQSLWTNLPWTTTPGSTSENASGLDKPEWLTGAQTLLNDAVQGAMEGASKAVSAASEAVQSVDRSALEGGLAHLRDASDQLVRDVQNGVSALSEDAAKTDTSPASILESIRTQTKEALDLFNDKESVSSHSVPAGSAPWDPTALPEAERAYANSIRERMLQLVVDSIYSRDKREAAFLSGSARRDGFSFDLGSEAGTQTALGVLKADPNVRRLRAGLVPAKMKEEHFWAEYFWHVRHTRRLLVAQGGKAPNDAGADDVFGEGTDDANKDGLSKPDADPDSERSPDSQEDSSAMKDWDKEIDEIFQTDEN